MMSSAFPLCVAVVVACLCVSVQSVSQSESLNRFQRVRADSDHVGKPCNNGGGTCINVDDTTCPVAVLNRKCPGSNKIKCCPTTTGSSSTPGTPSTAQPTTASTGPSAPVNTSDLCWPLKQDSTRNSVISMSRSFGSRRGGGARCHCGYDMYTKSGSAAQVVAVADGTVTSIFNFLKCRDGFGFGSRSRPQQTKAVMVYHPSLDKTINYGEMNHDGINVRRGDSVTKGQVLGKASYCHMLHFELYSGRQTRNQRWHPPSGMTVRSGGTPCVNTPAMFARKPADLDDPRQFLKGLENKFC